MSHDPPVKFTPTSERFSRRDLGRWAALSAVAAAMCGRANAQTAPIPIDQLDIGDPCRNFLHLLPQGTVISDMLFAPFIDVVDGMISSLRAGNSPISDRAEVEAALQDLRDFIQDEYQDQLHLAHIYTHDDLYGMAPIGKFTQWKVLYTLLREPYLTNNIAMPFLSLPTRSTHDDRKTIQTFFASSNSLALVGSVPYHQLFVVNRDVALNLSTPQGIEKYRLIRQAFKLGVFDYSRAQLGMSIIPNNRCFSESALPPPGNCIQLTGSYCELHNGLPTSASDSCP